MKLLLMPRDPDWWISLVIVVLLATGLAGFEHGFVAAIGLSTVQTLSYLVRLRSFLTAAVQIRLAFTLLLIACYPELMRWLYWLPAVGSLALITVGYCPMARMLALMPWNRRQKLTAGLILRTLFSAPVATRRNPPSGAPAIGCPGGVCVIESYAAVDDSTEPGNP